MEEVKEIRSNSINGEIEEPQIYSHSKLWLYESCPEFYKIKYIDKIPIEMPVHISLFLGKAVHEALEWLYHQVRNYEVELDELIEYFNGGWRAYMDELNGNIKYHNGDEEIHFNKGVKFLVDYYTRNKPFNQNVLAIERKILFPLDAEGKYKIQGFIDRVDFNEKENIYEIHDYKTNNYPKTQREIDSDKQLAFYHIGLKEAFGDDIKVKLVWHFLSHNLQMFSRRTDEELEKLKKETLELIKRIENEKEWPACGSRYCDWCSFKNEKGFSYEDLAKEIILSRTIH